MSFPLYSSHYFHLIPASVNVHFLNYIGNYWELLVMGGATMIERILLNPLGPSTEIQEEHIQLIHSHSNPRSKTFHTNFGLTAAPQSIS